MRSLTLKITYILVLSLIIPVLIRAQVINWESKSDRTYVYEISNKNAEKLLKSNPSDSVLLKILNEPIDFYYEKWEKQPNQGHFIHANIIKNKVHYSYEPVVPFQVFLFKEYGILSLQVIDAEGNIRSDAKVRIRGSWRLSDSPVSFDKESQTYRIDDWSEKTNRILTVELDKFNAIFDLEKHLVNPWYDNSYSGGGYSPSFYSYMITDKNKYKPGETVRFKSYALSNRKRPLKKALEVWMSTGDYKYKKITSLEPYHEGGFAGEVELHDSLELRLDRSYNIQLKDDKGRVVANTSFKYEDYELFDSKMEVQIEKRVQYYPDTNKVEIKVMDTNGLLLQDVKADIYIKRRSVSNIYTDLFIMPDTILHEQITLDNISPTVFNIPPSLFGESDCTYELEVLVFTIDNQRLEYRNTISFFRSHQDFVYSTRGDTIRFEYKELGVTKNVKARLTYNRSEDGKLVDLPYEEAFNQTLYSYDFELPDSTYRKSIYIRNVYDSLDIQGGISVDSFNVKLVNPLNLELSWYMYQGNILIGKGSGKEFDFKYSNTELDVMHYVEIFYSMGEEEHAYRRVFVPKTEYLSVDVDLPERIYPGQKLDATITVKDNYNNPVKNVDLTAFAVNSQLNYYVPDLPYYGAAPKTREQRSSYSIEEKDSWYMATDLDYTYWNKMANLEAMPYYQFTYPRKGMFTYTVATPDSTTQFAPYVMKGGEVVDIYVIEKNGYPIYFSWTQQPQGYSFIGSDTTKQRISLRLHDRVIILDSIRFEKGKKTILSLDMDYLPYNARAVELNNRDKEDRLIFTDREINTYKYYISRIPVDRKSSYTYLKQENKIYPIYHSCLNSFTSTILIGPLPQGKNSYLDKIEYKHEGGFSYQFDDNVVYKYPEKVYPEFLRLTSNTNFKRLNEFVLTKSVFDKVLADCRVGTSKWHPSSIHISQLNMNMTFRLPIEKDSTGVSNLLLRNHKTDKIHFPDKLESGTRVYSEIPDGEYDVILLYNSGKYLRFDSVPLMKHTHINVNMRKSKPHKADSLSMKWLELRTYSADIGIREPVVTTTLYSRPIMDRKGANIVSGYVYDESGEPLIGVSIIQKGTTYGAVTNLDGYFEMNINDPECTLEFRYIGFKTKEMQVSSGSSVSATLEEEVLMLEEVAVIGYGVSLKRSVTGSVSTITYDAATPQSPPEDFEEDDSGEVKEDAEDRLYNELLQLNGLRTNFSDVGFWEPRLYTDRKGKAQFSVTFPDNITKWEAVVYAMNRKLKTGTVRKSIRSYKPLMAELKMPSFLVQGDSSYVAGPIRNYTKDKTIAGKVMFALGQDTLMNKEVSFEAFHQEKMLVTAAGSDSISATYLFNRDDGYTDGELRSIPIERQGTEIAEGTLSFLRNGDKVNVASSEGEEVFVTITGKQIDVYMDATYYLTGYKYACNEQLASKLMGLLNYKIYKQFLGEKFKHDKNINQIIKRLVDNRNTNRLWSWWGNSSNTSYWMSAHVMKALRMAKDAGYKVNTDLTRVKQNYMDINSYRYTSLYDIEILHALSENGAQQDFKSAVEMFEKEIREREIREDSIAKAHKTRRNQSFLKEKLLLWSIRQNQNIGYSSDSIKKYLKKDVLGAVYCDDGIKRSWYADNLATTLIAYRMIKKDSTLLEYKEPMQMYVLGTKRNGWNTYQASSAVSAILPDLIAESTTKDNPATVIIEGKESRTLTEFPYETQLSYGERLDIEKKDGMPLIYSAYSKKYVTKENIGDAFEISSKILSVGDTLVAGVPVTLTVKVKVKQKNAEHIIIEVPIPAGCSYASKPNYFYNREVHREYFKEKTAIFCEKMPEGEYEFNIELLPRNTG